MRPTQRQFHGPLAGQLRSFAAAMERTGGSHAALFLILQRLDGFLAAQHPDLTHLSRAVLHEWFASFAHLRPASQSRYRSAAFQLCKYLARQDPRTACLEDFAPVRLDHSFRAHIFSVEEVTLLLTTARAQTPRPSPLRPQTLELIVAILYCAGLRIGEVVRLDVGDYDPAEGTLCIRHTKFDKSRLVPLSGSCQRLIASYLQRRAALGLDNGPATPLIWPLRGLQPHRASLASVQSALVHLMGRCGIRGPTGSGPRIQDMRHSFATHRVRQWYREGVDVPSHLPHLSTYMGHRGIESTQHYLQVLPGVLEEASPRFACFAGVGPDEKQVGHDQP
ncbi:MAG: tyrosine-type recombinase/integrase [Candidatus Latescibacterota bacterium]